jgi:hypothetical protein
MSNKTIYTEKNTPHPDGPRVQRRKNTKNRCKRLKLARNKLMRGVETLYEDVRKCRNKVGLRFKK